jgi:hypothetical protein
MQSTAGEQSQQPDVHVSQLQVCNQLQIVGKNVRRACMQQVQDGRAGSLVEAKHAAAAAADIQLTPWHLLPAYSLHHLSCNPRSIAALLGHAVFIYICCWLPTAA